MRQYDVVRIAGVSNSPFVLVLQNEINAHVPTVVVAPIVRPRPGEFIQRLNIAIEIEGEEFIVVMQELSAVPRTRLKSAITNRSDLHQSVMAAVDLLFAGF